jgi:PIN domain nuclease of toxin-antitoxin system
VAEPIALVTDTHPLLYHAREPSKLPARVARHFAACERGEALTYVPAPVAWEISLLARVGKVRMQRSVASFFADLFSNPAYQPVDLTFGEVLLADEGSPNDDPFDALIVAAARDLDLPLITRDADIERCGLVAVVW